MFQKLIRSEAALRRHSEAPFAAERERYLQHCADLGATYATLRQKGTELLWIARLLDKNAPQGVSAEQLEEVVRRRTSVHKGRTTAQRVINIARPWLRFLGWWREQPIEYGKLFVCHEEPGTEPGIFHKYLEKTRSNY